MRDILKPIGQNLKIYGFKSYEYIFLCSEFIETKEINNEIYIRHFHPNYEKMKTPKGSQVAMKKKHKIKLRDLKNYMLDLCLNLDPKEKEDDMPNHRRTRNNQKLKSLFTQYISPAFDAGLFRCDFY